MSNRTSTCVTLGKVIAGDIGETLDASLAGITSLNGVTSIIATVQRRLSDEPVVLEVSVVDPAARLVRIDCGTDPTDWLPSRPTPGHWFGQFEVTFADDRVLTWPAITGKPDYFGIDVGVEQNAP